MNLDLLQRRRRRRARALWLPVIVLALIVIGNRRVQADWHIQPSTCVVEQIGKHCVMHVQIRDENWGGGAICVDLESTTLFCGDVSNKGIELAVSFAQDSELRIYQNENVLHRETLLIQTLTGKQPRRRIRLPWSLF